MRWARPELDDSLWGTMDLTPPEGSYDPITGSSGFTPGWTSHGYKKLIGYAWYRMRVNVQSDTNPGESPTLALTMPLNFDDAYQVYADGRLIGQFGDFNEKSVVFYNSQPRGFALPKDTHSGPVVIAIRFWMDPSTPLTNPDVGGLHGPPMLGQASSIDAMLRLEWDSVNRTQVGNLLTITMMALATVLGLVLFWLDRSEPAYFWLAMASLVNMLTRVTVLIGYYTMILPMGTESFMTDVLFQGLGLGLWALFWGYWFGLSRFRRTARLVIGLVCLSSACMALLRPPLFGTVIPVTASAWLLPISLCDQTGAWGGGAVDRLPGHPHEPRRGVAGATAGSAADLLAVPGRADHHSRAHHPAHVRHHNIHWAGGDVPNADHCFSADDAPVHPLAKGTRTVADGD